MVAGGTEGNKCGDFHFICNILSLKQIWSKKRFFVNFLLFVYFIFEIITVLSKYFKLLLTRYAMLLLSNNNLFIYFFQIFFFFFIEG